MDAAIAKTSNTQLGPFIADLLLRDNHISLLDSVWLSPAGPAVPASKELFRGFPPMFVLSGGSEWYVRSVRELVRRCVVSEVDIGTWCRLSSPKEKITQMKGFSQRVPRGVRRPARLHPLHLVQCRETENGVQSVGFVVGAASGLIARMGCCPFNEFVALRALFRN